jgi:molybdenum cofactor synthesis domain-containing protein
MKAYCRSSPHHHVAGPKPFFPPAVEPLRYGPLLAAGVARVSGRRLPKVVIIPTGSELVPTSELDRDLPPDHLPEFNSVILAGLVTELGVPAVRAIVPDEVSSLTGALKDALGDADVVIINAGSSAGTEDYTYQAVANLGEDLVHGVSMMPGKPTLLGILAAAKALGLDFIP